MRLLSAAGAASVHDGERHSRCVRHSGGGSQEGLGRARARAQRVRAWCLAGAEDGGMLSWGSALAVDRHGGDVFDLPREAAQRGRDEHELMRLVFE